jgi:hypothetical protein
VNYPEALEFFRNIRGKREDITLLDLSTPALLDRHKVEGSVCLLGSKSYKLSAEQIANWRSFYSRRGSPEFMGIDVADGPNVDLVADLCDPDFGKHHPTLLSRFGWVICGALLEHVKDPFQCARNVELLVKPGGHLFYQGPWIWGYHPYPDDYFRYTISALRELFPNIEWTEWAYSGTNGKFGICVDDPRIEREIFQISLPKKERPETMGELLSDRAMPYLNVNAVGLRSSLRKAPVRIENGK